MPRTALPTAALMFDRALRRPARFAACAAVVLAGLLQAGCSTSEDDDSKPTVTLAATPTSGAAGATVTLIAVAQDDDNGVSEVKFFRVDSGTNTLLGTLNVTPFQLTTTLPTNVTGSISYFARAVDGAGNTADSAVATVTITTN